MLREVLPEYCPPYVLPLPYNLSQHDVTVNLTSVLLIRQSDSGAPVCKRVKAKGGHFEHTHLDSSFRLLLVWDKAVCLSE